MFSMIPLAQALCQWPSVSPHSRHLFSPLMPSTERQSSDLDVHMRLSLVAFALASQMRPRATRHRAPARGYGFGHAYVSWQMAAIVDPHFGFLNDEASP